MRYAEVFDVEAGFRSLDAEESKRCEALLDEASVVIDAYNADAELDRKKLVACRLVRRQLGDGEQMPGMVPIGASQGSASALGYTQSWSMSGGTVGEIYLSKLDKKLLGVGSKIGAHSPLEALR